MTMPSFLTWFPTPPELDRAPELAVLAALDGVLEITFCALLAAHPELADAERPYWRLPASKSSCIAANIVVRAEQLRRDLTTYRRCLGAGTNVPDGGNDGDDSDFPF